MAKRKLHEEILGYYSPTKETEMTEDDLNEIFKEYEKAHPETMEHHELHLKEEDKIWQKK